MPLELIADRPGHAVLQPYDEPPLGADQVRVRTLFSSVKHGTELRGFRADSEDALHPWDPDLQIHRRDAQPKPSSAFPKRLGNMCLGVVTEVGERVRKLRLGD